MELELELTYCQTAELTTNLQRCEHSTCIRSMLHFLVDMLEGHTKGLGVCDLASTLLRGAHKTSANLCLLTMSDSLTYLTDAGES